MRRLEGVLLHPVRDSAGVHRFREAEVDQLSRQLADTGSVRPPRAHFDDDGPSLDFRAPASSPVGTLADDADAVSVRERLEEELREAKQRAGDLVRVAELRELRGRQERAELERDHARRLEEAGDLARMRLEALALLSSLSPRELRALPAHDLETLLGLIDL